MGCLFLGFYLNCLSSAFMFNPLSSFHFHSVNHFDESACCSIALALSKLPSLQDLSLDYEVSAADCIRSGHWQRAGLVVPPDEVVRKGWLDVVQFLQAGPFVAVHELRLMLIGDGEVGKTSLANACHASDCKAERILKEQRTVGIDISSLSFAAEDHPTITCQVCDFAGQEVYHLSHTLHFTRRCLYVELEP